MVERSTQIKLEGEGEKNRGMGCNITPTVDPRISRILQVNGKN